MKHEQVVRYRDTNHRVLHGVIIKETKKKIHVVFMEPGARVRVLPLEEKAYMTPLEYPVKKAKRLIRRAAKGWEYKTTSQRGEVTRHNVVGKASKQGLKA